MSIRPTRVRRLRIRRAIGRTLFAAILVAAGMVYLSIRSQGVTLVVDGQPVAVPSMNGNVGQLLADNGIDIRGSDQVHPSPSTAVADGMTVTVDLGGVDQAKGSSGSGIWVVEGAGGGRHQLLSTLLAEDPSLRGGSVGRSSINSVEVIVGGKEHDVLTNAATVEELLSAMGNAPDGDARVLPPPSTPIHSGILIRADRVRTVEHTVVRRIPFRVDETYTTDLDPGTIEVNRPGRVGRGRYTYETEIVNGKEVSRKLVTSTIIKKPVSERRTFGEVVPVDTQAKAHPIYGTKDSETGQASWYDPPWSGLTAANKTLALGTQVTVTNLENGKSVVVTIDDRGPYGPGRVIDLSPEAFSQISDLGTGVLNVRISW